MMLIYPFLKLFVVTVFVVSCALPKPFSEVQDPQSVSLKIISYNIWHGLGQGFFKRKELEENSRRDKRLAIQLQLLKEAKPDILFLQELNPVSNLSKKIATELGMTPVFHEGNCGISFFGVGIPTNLSTGTAIFVRPPIEIKKIRGLKLSGPVGGCNSVVTFQYQEFRYALFALAYHPDYGSFFLINTHLHHGVELSPLVREQLKTWETNKLLSSSQILQLTNNINQSKQRRQSEVDNLFKELSALKTHYGDLPVVLAGDFNATVNSPIYKTITQTQNLKDSLGSNSPTPYTWDPVINQDNFEYSSGFGLSAPTFDKPEVKSFFKTYDKRQRRIDYVFLSQEFKILSHSLFAGKANSQGLIASDHFGLLVLTETKLPGFTSTQTPETNDAQTPETEESQTPDANETQNPEADET